MEWAPAGSFHLSAYPDPLKTINRYYASRWHLVLLTVVVASGLVWLAVSPRPKVVVYETHEPVASADSPFQPSQSEPRQLVLPSTGQVSSASSLTAPVSAPVLAVSSESFANSRRNAEASERMIQAHSSLREREIADPNSVSNRKDLDVMLRKAMESARRPTESSFHR